jgi:hypothetical protein
MKQLARILSLLILVAAATFFTACDKGDDEETDETAAQIAKLVGTWGATSVTLDGVNDPHTADYADFTITISESSNNTLSYSISGRPAGGLSPWPASGTFTFGNPVTSLLNRSDNVPVTYSVSGTALTLSILDYSGEGYAVPGRVASISGDWVFTLTKQ